MTTIRKISDTRYIAETTIDGACVSAAGKNEQIARDNLDEAVQVYSRI